MLCTGITTSCSNASTLKPPAVDKNKDKIILKFDSDITAAKKRDPIGSGYEVKEGDVLYFTLAVEKVKKLDLRKVNGKDQDKNIVRGFLNTL